MQQQRLNTNKNNRKNKITTIKEKNKLSSLELTKEKTLSLINKLNLVITPPPPFAFAIKNEQHLWRVIT